MEKMILITLCLVAVFHATHARPGKMCEDKGLPGYYEDPAISGTTDCAHRNNTRRCSFDFYARSLCKKSCNLCGCKFVTGGKGGKCGDSSPLGTPVTEESLAGSCGERKVNPYGVIAGKDATAGKWPWQLLLLVRFGAQLYPSCGATLISKRWAVTAAHCLSPDIKPLSYIVRAGDLEREVKNDREVEVGVSKLIIHPEFDSEPQGNDIALLKFDKDITFTDYIQPACLPSGRKPSNECYLTGWGHSEKIDSTTRPTMAKILQEARLPIVNQETCKTTMETYMTDVQDFPEYKVLDGMMCAGNLDAPETSCFGDSGGPLVCRNEQDRWELRGAVSHGTPECDGFTVFSKITHYKEWILEQMRK